jgi:ABC-type branched-subunit amino acid transport system ATPase component
VSGLGLADISVRYGGATAVDAVSLSAPLGRITGLFGPNGAGKTSLFNACSGLLRPSSGTVHLFDRDVTGEPTHVRARQGLGRTFQRIDLIGSASVERNVSLGREARTAGASFLRQCRASAVDRRAVAAATSEAMELCGITALRQRRVASLSTGQKRLVDLARVIAGGFTLLLLDEPSSGLDATETEAFGTVLSRLVAEKGCGILLVEHDMSLALSLCEHLFVLDFGRLIFEGSAKQLIASDDVRSAYLGEAH